jgi:hypothetical protein
MCSLLSALGRALLYGVLRSGEPELIAQAIENMIDIATST